jgi:hypothetical protein
MLFIKLKLLEFKMSVKHQHAEYTGMIAQWQRCEDVCGGQSKIHDQGTEYLDRLTNQTEVEYLSYLRRAPFYNATWRTLVGLQGMIFRKPPKVELPAVAMAMTEDITLSGTSLHMVALEVAEECLKIGRVGLFVDYPVVPENTTVADALLKNYRPSMKIYSAKSIINWKTATINNKTMLSMVVLKEYIDVPKDEFESVEQEQYRVLDMSEVVENETSNFRYRVRVFQVQVTNGVEKDVLIEENWPMIDGQYLDAIPFQFIGVDNVSWEVDEPPLIDLVDMNISHYKTTADYEHGCHFTGLPTPVISGYTPQPDSEGEMTSFSIGSTTAWVFPRPDAKASYLEFTGQGLQALRDNLAMKEARMAVLGARMLEVQVRGVESANTAAIHRSGEQSMLASVAQAISIGIQKALVVFCKFAGATDTSSVKFELNKDFFPVPMDALTITALIAGWQNAAYSYETMFNKLKDGGIIGQESTMQGELDKISANPPPALNAPTTPGNLASASPTSPKPAVGAATLAPTITQLQNKP